MIEHVFEDSEAAFDAQGHVFRDVVRAQRVRIDGDLICRELHAQSVLVTNGSLLCPAIDAPAVDVTILGVFDGKPVTRAGWRFTWVRPIAELPAPAEHSSAETMRRGVEEIARQLAGTLRAFAPWVEKLQAADRCAPFWRTMGDFMAAVRLEYRAGGGTPLQRQFFECIERHGLPLGVWRW